MANKSEVRKGLDIGRVLVYGVASFDAYAMGRAFHVYDPAGWAIGNVNVAGLILGAVINLIVAQAAIHLPDLAATFSSLKESLPTLSKKMDKKQVAQHKKDLKKMLKAGARSLYSHIGYFVLLGLSVVLVAPAMFNIWSEALDFSDTFVSFMAFVGSVAPAVAITVGGFIASDAGSDSQRRSATLGATVSDAQRPIQRRSATKPATLSAKIYRCECGEEFVNRNKYSGHTGKCVKYQEKKRAQLDPTLLIDPSKVVKQ